MPENLKSRDIEELMAEADELIRQINADIIEEMKEEHLLELEKYAQRFKTIKATVQEKAEKQKDFELSDSADGMHEAILDIVTAMQEFKDKLFRSSKEGTKDNF
ncbi:hypothetical protein [Desulfosudis oleivorans]|uniref:Uncharacterized protein n=1 Tax=Desulfosudis oleivorans (strain DSM 6200 / JCM 39069 / Hxd3) TaxID=96561 RepID=A8ZV34_DESOH|nr:hypothetical protein [Desulfosudis oleivorans]ABW68124.1 hypothetical protein Dole_2320 [Desulfosudis oleivorans Hxd3]